MIFSCTQLSQTLINDGEGSFQLFFEDDERWAERQYRAGTDLKAKAAIQGEVEAFFGTQRRRCLCTSVTDEVDRDLQAQSPHIADDRMAIGKFAAALKCQSP